MIVSQSVIAMLIIAIILWDARVSHAVLFRRGEKTFFRLVNLPDIVLFVWRKIVSFLSRELTGFCTICIVRNRSFPSRELTGL